MFLALFIITICILLYRELIRKIFFYHVDQRVESVFSIKKSLSYKIKQLKTSNRRVCAIVINLAKNYTCLLLPVYLPCDTYCNTVSEEYVKCIDYIESLFESVNCNSFICCGDFNTSFE